MNKLGRLDSLDELRVRATHLSGLGADGDLELLALRPDLERDTAWWPVVWAPACALAAHRLGRPDRAWELLETAVSGGFYRPERFGDDLDGAFGSDPRWAALKDRIAANVPKPPLELLQWPDPSPIAPLRLARAMPGREALLRDRLPWLQGNAWDATRQLVAWVRRQWRHHSGNRADGGDAVAILDRVAAGERFGSDEYATVLAHALNAVGIPARRVGLWIEHYYSRFGTGHRVTEAWIDDLRRWVLLDGQNGAIWSDGDVDAALGTLELQHRFLAGDGPPTLIGLDDELDDKLDEAAAAHWWQFFANVQSGGVGFGAEGFVPYFGGSSVFEAEQLVAAAAASSYPDLGQVSIGIADAGGLPAIRFESPHPYTRGFVLRADDQRIDIGGEPRQWVVDLRPGRHEIELFVATRYAELAAGRLVYRARQPG